MARQRFRYVNPCIPPGWTVWVSDGHYMLYRSTRTGHVLACALGVIDGVDEADCRLQMMNHLWRIQMLRKDASAARAPTRHASPGDLSAHWPDLAEWLTSAVYENDQSRREAPTVTLWCSGGQWKASLKDRAEGLVLWLSAETVVELLQLADLYCLSSEAPWRHDEQDHERYKKRVKKDT